MLLSIIIPAYNVESYIAACINSIFLNLQNPSQVEVVITNDGSTDRTLQIIEEQSLKFKSVKIVNQRNLGVSVARNEAVKNSSGEFLLFLDADDSLELNSLNVLMDKLEKFHVDLLLLGYKQIDSLNNTLFQSDFTHLPKSALDKLDFYYSSTGGSNKLADSNRCWGYAFKASLVKQMEKPFTEGAPYLEDAAFLAKFFLIMDSYAFDDLILYKRLVRVGSAVNSNLFSSERAIAGFGKIVNDLIAFRNKENSNSNIKKDRIKHLNQSLIKFLTLEIISALNSKSRKLLATTIVAANKHKVEYDWKGVRYPYSFWGWAYNVSIYFFIVVYYVQSKFWYLLSKLR